jgi:glutamyl-tRNA reductase
MGLIACGINHKTAPVTLRERVAVPTHALTSALQNLSQTAHLHEAAILSTCNRTEFYCVDAKPHDLLAWLSDYQHLSQTEIAPYFYSYTADAALEHMLRVASGLDSMVIGEPQILGQMKQAFACAKQIGLIGSELHQVFRHVLTVTKRIRSTTAIGVNPISIAYAAVQLARHIFSHFKQSTVLLVGAGETVQLAAKHLYEQGLTQLLFCNRTDAAAKRLAEQFNGQGYSLEELPNVLPQADIVFTATASQLPIVGKGMIEQALKIRRRRPMLMIDLAMPRDIEPQVAQLEDVYLYNLDDMQDIISQNLNQRLDAAKQAEQIITLEVAEFGRWQRSLKAVDLIKSYREQVMQLRELQLSKAQKLLAQGQDPMLVLSMITQALTNQIMHHPSTQLRMLGAEGQDELIDLARQLLGLDIHS